MAKCNVKNSIYGDQVRERVGAYLREVNTSFTLKEFADWAGFRLTGNLRKRIKTMVYAGEIGCFYAYFKRHGSVIVYFKPEVQPQFHEVEW